ncbi:MAG: helicase-related protein, partial [Aggregatilineales bacterium]
RPWSLKKMPDRTILVAFSRRKVLALKAQLENENRTISVVYGSLPPEVRRKQADRFANGETQICIATDAVGMGLNLPADHVCFHETKKYDGRTVRNLTPTEIHQIGGRAGRYGMSEGGTIGATTRKDLNLVRILHKQEPATLTHAHVAPTVEDLAMIPGSLGEKLREWAQLQSIPEELRHLVATANLKERINLAEMLTDEEVETLGLDRAVQLTNAPTRRSSRDYWYACAQSIIEGEPMPVPDIPPTEIFTASDLDYTETCINKADVYLWLSNRQEFEGLGPDAAYIKEERASASLRIDEALLKALAPEYYSEREFWQS